MMRLLVLLLCLVLGGCNQSSSVNQPGGGHPASGSLRVLSYNIHHGRGMDGVVDLQRIADVINAVKPDLVALQEVDRGVERTGRIDEPAILGELTGMHVVFEKNIDYQGGEYGNAVLSRLPVDRYINHKLPSQYEGEQRGLLEVHIKLGDRLMVFYATHFEYREDPTERLASADMLRGLIDKQGVKTIIVAGDLNARPGSETISKLNAFLVDTHAVTNGSDSPAYTYPADKPDRRIDYILHTPDAGLTAIESRVLDEAVASDHRPVFCVIKIMAD